VFNFSTPLFLCVAPFNLHDSKASSAHSKRILIIGLPTHQHDDDADSNGDEAQTLSSHKEDSESGQGTSTLHQSNKHPSGNCMHEIPS
jgi:hypothetical protein